MNPRLFVLIPSISFLCNTFLFAALLTARKNKTIQSFKLMLVSFMLWSGGSAALRLQLAPSPLFWWEVSLIGIILVPCCYYLLACNFLESRGYFLKRIWGAVTLLLIVLNRLGLFVSSPEIVFTGGRPSLTYDTRPLAVLPVVLALCMFISMWRLMRAGLRQQSLPPSALRPLLLGVAIMLLGIVLPILVPGFNTLPLDTAACGLNAICIYYALYKKRLFTFSQIASQGPTYLITIFLTCLSLILGSNFIDSLFDTFLFQYAAHKMIIVAVFCTIFGILAYNALNILLSNMFVRDKIARENRLHALSAKVNRTLRLDEIIDAYVELLTSSTGDAKIYICLYDEAEQCYVSSSGNAPLQRRFTLRGDHPIILCLKETDSSISYADFSHSVAFKSMWEQEKRLMQELQIRLLLPIRCDGTLVGVTLLSEKADRRSYTFDETIFLESSVSIVSIAMQNANLYETIRREAERDSLTGLYNRRTFNNQLQEMFVKHQDQTICLAFFNLDNFHLYNELYGSDEGDRVLIYFSALLQQNLPDCCTAARYSGKEFAVLMPLTDLAAAQSYAERIQAQLCERIEPAGETTRRLLTFSAGICSYPIAASSPTQLVSYANLAVFAAKQRGKNRIVVYTRSLSAEQQPQQDKATIGQEYTPTIYALTAAIDAKDHYTFNHSRCVSSYAAQLAKAYGLDEEHVEIIRQAGLLHDIGKIGVPDAILGKTGMLEPDEMKVMRQHVEFSIEMIRHLPSLTYVIPLVLGHHERFDGKGYPRGIAGENIPIGARCLCVVDSFDAMVSKRSYKKALPVSVALEEIRKNLGTQFDPELGQLFIRLIESGTIVPESY